MRIVPPRENQQSNRFVRRHDFTIGKAAGRRLLRQRALGHTEDVPEFCTCGAELPPDARFCHKCAKPQRDEPVAVELEPPAPPPPAPSLPPAPPKPIGFHNPLAVRLGFMTAMLASFFNVLLFYAFPLWLVAAGFLCVYVYQRRTGEALTMNNGARIGWITGLFSFIAYTVLSTLTVISLIQSGEYLKLVKSNPVFQQQQQLLDTPGLLVFEVVFILTLLFVVFTALAIAGGVLGAKLLGKDRPAAVR